jgi:hypothetical protein
MLEGVGDELPVQDLVQLCIVASVLGGTGWHGDRP